MMRHVHRPLPRKTHVREGMSVVELHVAKTMDALLYGRFVQCECGCTGFIRRGRGIRWSVINRLGEKREAP